MTAATERPRWVRGLYDFVTDDIVDGQYEYPMDGSDDWVLDLVEDAVNNVLCNVYGHEVVDDQCGITEHRFCVWCKRRGISL